MNKLLTFVLLGISFLLNAQEQEISKEINYYELGGQYAESGDFTKAITCYEKEIFVRPKNYFAWFNMALAESYLGQKEKALKHYTQAIILKPDYARAYVYRALVLKDMKMLTGALNDLDMAVLTDPEFGLGYFHRGIVHEYLENRTQACLDIKAAKRLHVENIDSLLNFLCREEREENYANIVKIYEESRDETYGFKRSNPIKTGVGLYGGIYNQVTFLELLRDKNGAPVQYKSKGECCAYDLQGTHSGKAKLSVYKVTFTDESGKKKTVNLYFTAFEFQSPKIPAGFKRAEY